ncbi:hemicentin-1 [Menidia menidia]
MLSPRMLGILTWMLLLSDADSTCAPELDILTVYPPVIKEEYGSVVRINCSTDGKDADISLLVGDEILASSFGVDIESNLTLTKWNTNPVCKIQRNGSLPCIQEFDITVYKIPEVTLSKNEVEVGAEERQHELKCDVIGAAPAQNLSVTWYKDDQIFTTAASLVTTRAPVNESFTLRVNMSKGENAATFRCEAQLDLGPEKQLPPVVSQTYNISGFYAPQLIGNHSLDRHIRVSEGQNVTLACHVKGNPPPVFQWTVDGKKLLENTSKLNIIAQNNNATYTCTATNELGNLTVKTNVYMEELFQNAASTVTPTSEAPTIKGLPVILSPAEVVVRYGDPVEINCTSLIDVAGIGWEASVGGTGFLNLSHLVWRVESLTQWHVKPFCYVTLKNNTQITISPNVTLYKPPDVVSVSKVGDGPMTEGIKYTLKCDIKNVAPVQLQVKWYKGNETLLSNDYQQADVYPANVSVYFYGTATRDDHGSVFRCEVELQLGPKGPQSLPRSVSAPYTANVHYKPLFVACPDKHTAEEGNFTLHDLHCKTDGNPPSNITWYHNGRPINSLVPLFRKDSGVYTAEIANTIGNTSTNVSMTLGYKPSLICREEYEVEVNSEVKNLCEPQGSPKPSVTWFREGQMFSRRWWSKQDAGQYSVKATNQFGTAEHKFNLHILYAPEFTGGNVTEEFVQSGNVTLNCSAEGNPSPVIHWLCPTHTNVQMSTVGRYNIITVTQATSSNAGVYGCVATNKVGNVTRFFSLVEKGKTDGGSHDFPEFLLIILIIIILVLLIVIVFLIYKQKKKQGQYSFITSSDPSSIPMVTKSAGTLT